ncbi:MAG: RICIN domain-containing protein [Coriobacteriia bacterium]|nr:RICIN domain-containing protein [Coriobacteriia bacterium]
MVGLTRNLAKAISRLISVVVALCLTVTLMPLAYADEGASIDPLAQEINEAASSDVEDATFSEAVPSEDETPDYEVGADDEYVEENAESDTDLFDDEADEDLEFLDEEENEEAEANEADTELSDNNGPEALSVSGAGGTRIKDGVYTISTSLNKKFTLGIGNSSAKTGAKIQLKAKKNTLSQKFYFAHISKNEYTIHVLRSGKYLDVSHSKVVQRPKSDTSSQVWVAGRTKKGAFVLRNKASGKVMSVKGATAKSKANILLKKRAKNTTKNKANRKAQTFVLKPASALSPGSYCLKSLAMGKRLQAKKSLGKKGSLVLVGSPKNDNVQKWVFESAGKGYFRLRNAHTNKVLGVKNNSSASGAVVCLQKRSKAATQKWKAHYDGRGGFRLVNAHKTVLNIAGAGNVCAETPQSSLSQKFTISPTKLTTVRLDVPLVNQFPTAPTGCEIASLTMLLKYAGYKTTFARSLNEMWYSSNPHNGFVGNPRGWSGWTIYPKPAGKWIKKRIGSYKVLTGASHEKLRSTLREGKPIVVWMLHPRIGMHCLILTGFDKKGFYINDPYGTKDWFCSYKNFDRYWAGYSRMALTY